MHEFENRLGYPLGLGEKVSVNNELLHLCGNWRASAKCSRMQLLVQKPLACVLPRYAFAYTFLVLGRLCSRWKFGSVAPCWCGVIGLVNKKNGLDMS